ncbi:MAG: 2-amino-4-hydroxy-6-hydroxymethyldihydropteridine diphosphokinase [Candidatus Omnitrophica bacterium]|nr:2-amino-4-hydroxy-6-hydroxymethyldihydropteridine diphosphokinase [Candidatus Omnitrophota bacterium]
MERVVLAIGSNKGNRYQNIIKGIKQLEKYVKIKKISPFYKNPPIGAKGGNFLNGAVEIETDLLPYELLKLLKNIEKKIGRKFPHKKNDAREIDFDIIFYGNKIIKTKNLKIPHQKFRKREFVLKPLCEIIPDYIDLETNKNIKEIYEEFKNENIEKNKGYKKRDWENKERR